MTQQNSGTKKAGCAPVIAGIAFMFLLITINIGTMGGIGTALFMIGDLLAGILLPPIHGDNLLSIGMLYGFIWPFGAFIIYLITIGTKVPARWEERVAIYRFGSGIFYAGAFTLVLSFLFHAAAIA